MVDVGKYTAAPLVDTTFAIEAWRGNEIGPHTGTISVPDTVVDELCAAVDYLRGNAIPTLALQLADFHMKATLELGSHVRECLDSGHGFALLDKLPVGQWSVDECRAVYWLIGRAVGRPVAQSFDGKMLYDVADSGRPPGNGVRPDVTNIGQNFHTDNSYNTMPPDVVGLMCIHPAREGGVSGIVNFAWAYNVLADESPDLLARLQEPFYFDRQREHADGDTMFCSHPLFESRDGDLIARLSKRQVQNRGGAPPSLTSDELAAGLSPARPSM